jgi:hypothetical protein
MNGAQLSIEHGDSSMLMSGPPAGYSPTSGVSEPVIVHPHKKFLRHRETCGGADHRIDFASWTECSLTFINPHRNLGRREGSEAVETSTKRTALYFGAVKTGVFVRLDVRRVETVWIQAKHGLCN